MRSIIGLLLFLLVGSPKIALTEDRIDLACVLQASELDTLVEEMRSCTTRYLDCKDACEILGRSNGRAFEDLCVKNCEYARKRCEEGALKRRCVPVGP